MREIEGGPVEETATTLGIRPETVKTRLYRARRLLRGTLQDSLAATLDEAFPFLGPRCARMTEAVLARMEAARSEEHTSELQSLMRISYAVFCLKKKKTQHTPQCIQIHREQH